MNRRSFIERLALGMAGFTILPGAWRVWKATRAPLVPVVWMEQELMPYQIALLKFLNSGNRIEIYPRKIDCKWMRKI